MISPFIALKRFIVARQHLKQPIKKSLADLFRLSGFLLGPDLSPLPKALGYHTVGQGKDDLSITPEQFEEQLDWLQANGYHLITFRQWWSIVSCGQKPAPKTVVLTFDDGFKGTATHAAPILAKRGLAATVFIITNHVGGINNYDSFLGTSELPMMDWDDIQELKRLGWDIQSHGHRHRAHYRLPEDVRSEELIISKTILEEKLGEPVDFFCFPYGSFDEESANALTLAGYHAALTCRDGHLPEHSFQDRYLLKRTLIYGSMSQSNFISTFRTGHYRLYAILRTLKRLFLPKKFTSSSHDALNQPSTQELEAAS